MIVDSHMHLGSFASFYGPDNATADLLELMDYLGIDMAVQIHGAGIMECFEEALAESVKAWGESGGRLPFALTYHPHFARESLDLIRQSFEHPGGVAIKIHPGQHQVWPEDERYRPVWELAAERRVPIITHSWALSDYNPTQRFATPEHFEQPVASYPQVKLVLGHAGGRYEGHLAAARLARAYPNVYVDLSGDVYSFGFIEWLVEQIGADRILFGTDVNWMDPRTHLGRVLDADIPVQAKALILGENACRLFKFGG